MYGRLRATSAWREPQNGRNSANDSAVLTHATGIGGRPVLTASAARCPSFPYSAGASCDTSSRPVASRTAIPRAQSIVLPPPTAMSASAPAARAAAVPAATVSAGVCGREPSNTIGGHTSPRASCTSSSTGDRDTLSPHTIIGRVTFCARRCAASRSRTAPSPLTTARSGSLPRYSLTLVGHGIGRYSASP